MRYCERRLYPSRHGTVRLPELVRVVIFLPSKKKVKLVSGFHEAIVKRFIRDILKKLLGTTIEVVLELVLSLERPISGAEVRRVPEQGGFQLGRTGSANMVAILEHSDALLSFGRVFPMNSVRVIHKDHAGRGERWI